MSGASIALNIVRKQYREIREALVGDGMFTHAEVLQKALSVSDDNQELRAWKKLVSAIVEQQNGPHLREMLKELIE